jgi:hypothetical protein
VDVTGQRISDPVIVVLKLRAYEDMATYLRVKLEERDVSYIEAKDRTC